jgi:hypothetical protein
MSEETYVYQILRQEDTTEGRGPMRPDPDVWANEQDAWDQINDLHGVQGRRPPNCWPVPECKEHGIDNWQKYRAHFNYGGDFTVRKLILRPKVDK